jgi:myosin-18
LDFNDKRGLLWILEEESTSGGNEITFLEKLHSVHGEPDDFGEVMLKTTMDKGQFTILHCQRSLPITYDVTGWCTRVREHPSTRVVAQILTESKNKGVASLYQGRGVSASMSATSSKLELQGLSRLSRHPSFSNPTVGIKKSSQCLKTKFQLDFLVDLLRKTNQWYVICVLCQLPAYLPGALTPPNDVGIDEDELPLQGHIDVVLVRDQLRQSDVIPAARIYKQGFPVHQPLATFKRRFSVLLDPNEKAALPENDKDAAEFILSGLELDRNSYRIGLSQVFFRAGILSGLDRQVERKIHDIMVRLQANIRGWLGRQKMEDLELQHAAAHVIQRNIRQHDIINKWIWWKLFQKVSDAIYGPDLFMLSLR